MPQVRKEHIQQQIVDAAARVFARDGYSGAGIAAIAEAAGVSAGNVYRYYDGKDALFEAVVPDAFVHRFRTLLRRRMTALAGVSDVATLGPKAAWRAASEEFLAFAIEHRLQVVVLLGRAEGTRLEGFGERIVGEMVRLTIAHFRALRPGLKVTGSMRFNLDRIYRSHVATTVETLSRFDDEATIRAAVAEYGKYHLAGLKHFFA
jgi:AcrR family transcriptional regulator